jgi:hypothetical protein
VLELTGSYRPMTLGLARRGDAKGRKIVEAFAQHAKTELAKLVRM